MSVKRESASVVLIEGDGIGPEITEAALFVLEKASVKISWLPCLAGARAFEATGDALPKETVQAIQRSGLALKAPLTTQIGNTQSFRSVNVRLRQELDMFANVRPIRSIPGVKTRYENVDLIIVRENTEGLYSGLEHEITPGVVTSLKVSTKKACSRIAKFAFELAMDRKRKKVTGVHKANIMKLSDGLALDCYREEAALCPSIEYDEKIIDAAAMCLVLDPGQFDVLLMENLYGDILSDLGAGLIGGLGLAPSANYGEQVAVFEPVHGTAPDIAGTGKANPTALILSAVHLLKHINQEEAGLAVERAVLQVLSAAKVRTPDLGGSAKTMDYAKEIALNL